MSGCLVLCGACVVSFTLAVELRSASVIYVELMNVYNGTAAATAAVGSIQGGARVIGAPLAAMISRKASYHTTILVGVVMRVCGYVISPLAPTVHCLYLSIGMVAGIGGSLCNNACLMIIGETFTHHRGKALSLVTAANGVGAFVFPILVQMVIDEYGYDVTMYCIATVALSSIVAYPMFYCHARIQRSLLPQEATDAPRSSAPFEWWLLRRPDFLLFAVAFGVAFTGTAVCLHLFPALMIHDAGYTMDDASVLVGIFGLASCVFTLLHGFLYDAQYFRDYKHLLYVSMMLIGGICTGMAAFTDNYTVLVVLCVGLGATFGSTMSQFVNVLADRLHKEALSSAIGIAGFFRGAGHLCGPIMAGSLYDVYGTYTSGFYLSGSLIIVAANMMLISFCFWKENRDPSYLNFS